MHDTDRSSFPWVIELAHFFFTLSFFCSFSFPHASLRNGTDEVEGGD